MKVSISKQTGPNEALTVELEDAEAYSDSLTLAYKIIDERMLELNIRSLIATAKARKLNLSPDIQQLLDDVIHAQWGGMTAGDVLDGAAEDSIARAREEIAHGAKISAGQHGG